MFVKTARRRMPDGPNRVGTDRVRVDRFPAPSMLTPNGCSVIMAKGGTEHMFGRGGLLFRLAVDPPPIGGS